MADEGGADELEGRGITGPASEVIGQDRILFAIVGKTMNLKDFEKNRIKGSGRKECIALL